MASADSSYQKKLVELSPSGPEQHLRPNLILGICCLSLLLVGMDVTIVNVALPSIQHELHASLSNLQWVVDAYTLVVASLLMLAGSMSDRFGRRRTFQIGLGLFLLGSLTCSIAPSVGVLIACRALQGLGASMLNPVALSIIANVFTSPQQRGKAVGVWGAVGGLAFAIGPLLGGILTQTVGWRSVFWINIPIGLVAIFLTFKFVPESKAPVARAFDPIGQFLIFAGLSSLTYAMIEGPHAGWSSKVILFFLVVAVTSLIGFIVYEPRRAQPLVDLRFFRSIPFSSATVLAFSAFASFAGFLFVNVLYLQQARKLSAFSAGLCTLPLAIGMVVSSPLSGKLVGKSGARPSLVIAGLSFVVSTLLLTRLTLHTPLLLLLIAYGFFGIGLGMVNPAITNSAVSGMPLTQAGVAAAIASTSRQVGAALGVATAGMILTIAQTAGKALPEATHPVWWLMTVSGSVVLFLSWFANTPRAKASAQHALSQQNS